MNKFIELQGGNVFPDITIMYIAREHNNEANDFARHASTYKQFVLEIRHRSNRSIYGLEGSFNYTFSKSIG